MLMAWLDVIFLARRKTLYLDFQNSVLWHKGLKGLVEGRGKSIS